MSRHIYEDNLGYDLLRPIVDYTAKHSYRRIEIRGKESIPQDGAVIIAPNHCNTLMDALVILRSFHGPTVFGARADMFNSPMIAKIMYFLRILPMVRQRDGLRNVLKNHETNEIIVETLAHKVRFCIYPEGRHRPVHSLLPLGKGVFRAAFAANEKFGNDMPVYIVPAGIEYGDYFRYCSTSLVTYGKPINITEFIKEHQVENEAQLFEPLRKELRERISELITYINDDEDLHAKWELTKLVARTRKPKDSSLTGRMQLNKEIISELETAYAKKEDETASLLEKAKDFEKKRRRKGLSVYSFGKKNPALSCILKTIGALAGLPYFIFSAIASLPLWLTMVFLKQSIRDKAFRNTARFGVKLGIGPIAFLLWTVLSFCFLPWYTAVAVSLGTIPAYSYFHIYKEFIRLYMSDLKILGNKGLRKGFEEIIDSYSSILG